ncbi:hypothetical protein [Afipia sp. GAS231]|uniref:hypothetical protein n=1 Tax=Afipia sp. GAS231 TaxID=1882747 RepID=UPI00087CEBE4|nr:hypothetical protein [Afipia sp. GAS231]SDO49818.1 hypothetical protein SAMN05444050_4281 [Afipia sp. GAS231]
MSADEKKQPAKGGPRAAKGKKQMLVILDQDVIKAVKMAALEDEVPMSHAVEEAVREWLGKRKGRKAPKTSV